MCIGWLIEKQLEQENRTILIFYNDLFLFWKITESL